MMSSDDGRREIKGNLPERGKQEGFGCQRAGHLEARNISRRDGKVRDNLLVLGRA